MNDFFEENKKTIILILVLIVATIIISISSLFIGKSKNPKPKDAMKELGKIYYEELYYDKLVETYPDSYQNYLKKSSSDGIKVTLLDLISAIPSSNIDAYNDKKGNLMCDLNESYIIIKPYASYDKKDYSIEVVTKCDSVISFEEENYSNNSQNNNKGSDENV